MAIHKIHIEDFDVVDYNLIAIHTSLEDYRLAFKINQQLAISLSKNLDEITIQFKNQSVHFSRFTFLNQNNMMVWDLIQNKQETESKVESYTANLFENKKISNQVALINELKKVDYFLKIEQDNQVNISDIITRINNIDGVNTSYEMDVNAIKSKNNLIF